MQSNQCYQWQKAQNMNYKHVIVIYGTEASLHKLHMAVRNHLTEMYQMHSSNKSCHLSKNTITKSVPQYAYLHLNFPCTWTQIQTLQQVNLIPLLQMEECQ